MPARLRAEVRPEKLIGPFGAELAKPSGRERAEHRANVDAHVKDREPLVAPGVAGRIQAADHRGDIWLEQAVAADQQAERGVKKRMIHRFLRVKRQDDVPRHHQQAAHQHRADIACQPVGDQPAEERREVDQRHVPRRNVGRPRLVESVVFTEVEAQNVQHQIEAEPLPHLGEEERIEAFGVAEKRAEDAAGGAGRLRDGHAAVEVNIVVGNIGHVDHVGLKRQRNVTRVGRRHDGWGSSAIKSIGARRRASLARARSSPSNQGTAPRVTKPRRFPSPSPRRARRRRSQRLSQRSKAGMHATGPGSRKRRGARINSA